MYLMKCDICGKIIGGEARTNTNEFVHAHVECEYHGKEWDNVDWENKHFSLHVCPDCMSKLEKVLKIKGDKNNRIECGEELMMTPCEYVNP